LIAFPRGSFAQSPNGSLGEKSDEIPAQEIYLSFDYNGLLNSVVTSYYYQDSVYLPIGSLFTQLKVNCEIDPRDSIAKGFFIDVNNSYEINFSTCVAKIGKREIHFDKSQVMIKDLDFYLLPSVFSKIFGLDFFVDFSALSLALTTNVELPIVKDYERETRRNYSLVAPQAQLIQAPLEFPRKRSLLNGGVVDYSLTAYGGNNQNSYEYSLTGGAEILGGETEGTILGNISKNNSQLYSSDFSWKYAFDSTRYISYAGLGNLNSDGLTQFGFRGGQVSNEPVALRTYFGTYPIDAKTNPHWEVELYLNGQLVDYGTADANGNAHFTIPLVYGSSFIQLRYYGPNGEFEEQDSRLQIPFTFVPTGQVNYTISAGKLNNTDYNLISGNVVFGLADWLTDKIGVDYVDDPLFSKPLIYNSAYVRIGSEYTLSLDVAPQAFYRSTFNALYPSQASFDLSYYRYKQNLLYDPSDELQQAQADVYVPFSISNSVFSFRLAGTGQQYTSGEKTYSYSAYVNSSVAQVNASLGYTESFVSYGGSSLVQNYGLSASFLYSMFFGRGAFDFLNGSLADLSMRYGVLKNSLDDIRFELSKNVQQYIRVGFAAERDFVNRFTSFNLQIIADLPFTRSTTTAQSQGRTSWYTENLSGSVGFDSNYGRFLFNDVPWVGNSAASMRLFVDNNGDGVFDEGDEVIKEGVVTLRQAVSSEIYNDGVIREWNLLPYTQYSADIDVGSIKNPLWIPKEKSFSFISDPNSYKKIDIPFFAGGIVDGTVLKIEDGTATAIPGLSLEIRSVGSDFKKTLSVFGDGSFYYMGLPPGEYKAYVDSSQLAILDLESDPSILTFKVKPTKEGDYVEGLKIFLKEKKKTDTGELIETTPAKPSLPLPEQPATVAGRYLVQVGAFATRHRATKVASAAMKNTGQKFRVSFDSTCNLYIVQTDTFVSRQDALNELDLCLNWFDFDDVFVVNADEKHSPYLFAVQLATFRSLNAASEFADRVRKKIGSVPIIKYKRSIKIFSVLVGPFKTEEEAQKLSGDLRKSRTRGNAFVTIYGPSETQPTFTVQLGTFSNAKLAYKFAKGFRKQTGLMALVNFGSKEMRFKVFTPPCQTNTEAMTVFEKIRSFRNYQKAQLVSFR
jgi:cell division septation protein DedD